MAIEPFNKDDFRTAKIIRDGFVNCTFSDTEVIANGMRKLFGDGELTVSDNKESKRITVTVKSYPYIAQQYERTFTFFYHTETEDGKNMIADVVEITE